MAAECEDNLFAREIESRLSEIHGDARQSQGDALSQAAVENRWNCGLQSE
jgi:hypothetical protein